MSFREACASASELTAHMPNAKLSVEEEQILERIIGTDTEMPTGGLDFIRYIQDYLRPEAPIDPTSYHTRSTLLLAQHAGIRRLWSTCSGPSTPLPSRECDRLLLLALRWRTVLAMASFSLRSISCGRWWALLLTSLHNDVKSTSLLDTFAISWNGIREWSLNVLECPPGTIAEELRDASHIPDILAVCIDSKAADFVVEPTITIGSTYTLWGVLTDEEAYMLGEGGLFSATRRLEHAVPGRLLLYTRIPFPPLVPRPALVSPGNTCDSPSSAIAPAGGKKLQNEIAIWVLADKINARGFWDAHTLKNPAFRLLHFCYNGDAKTSALLCYICKKHLKLAETAPELEPKTFMVTLTPPKQGQAERMTFMWGDDSLSSYTLDTSTSPPTLYVMIKTRSKATNLPKTLGQYKVAPSVFTERPLFAKVTSPTGELRSFGLWVVNNRQNVLQCFHDTQEFVRVNFDSTHPPTSFAVWEEIGKGRIRPFVPSSMCLPHVPILIFQTYPFAPNTSTPLVNIAFRPLQVTSQMMEGIDLKTKFEAPDIPEMEIVRAYTTIFKMEEMLLEEWMDDREMIVVKCVNDAKELIKAEVQRLRGGLPPPGLKSWNVFDETDPKAWDKIHRKVLSLERSRDAERAGAMDEINRINVWASITELYQLHAILDQLRMRNDIGGRSVLSMDGRSLTQQNLHIHVIGRDLAEVARAEAKAYEDHYAELSQLFASSVPNLPSDSADDLASLNANLQGLCDQIQKKWSEITKINLTKCGRDEIEFVGAVQKLHQLHLSCTYFLMSYSRDAYPLPILRTLRDNCKFVSIRAKLLNALCAAKLTNGSLDGLARWADYVLTILAERSIQLRNLQSGVEVTSAMLDECENDVSAATFLVSLYEKWHASASMVAPSPLEDAIHKLRIPSREVEVLVQIARAQWGFYEEENCAFRNYRSGRSPKRNTRKHVDAEVDDKKDTFAAEAEALANATALMEEEDKKSRKKKKAAKKKKGKLTTPPSTPTLIPSPIVFTPPTTPTMTPRRDACVSGGSTPPATPSTVSCGEPESLVPSAVCESGQIGVEDTPEFACVDPAPVATELECTPVEIDLAECAPAPIDTTECTPPVIDAAECTPPVIDAAGCCRTAVGTNDTLPTTIERTPTAVDATACNSAEASECTLADAECTSADAMTCGASECAHEYAVPKAEAVGASTQVVASPRMDEAHTPVIDDGELRMSAGSSRPSSSSSRRSPDDEKSRNDGLINHTSDETEATCENSPCAGKKVSVVFVTNQVLDELHKKRKIANRSTTKWKYLSHTYNVELDVVEIPTSTSAASTARAVPEAAEEARAQTTQILTTHTQRQKLAKTQKQTPSSPTPASASTTALSPTPASATTAAPASVPAPASAPASVPTPAYPSASPSAAAPASAHASEPTPTPAATPATASASSTSPASASSAVPTGVCLRICGEEDLVRQCVKEVDDMHVDEREISWGVHKALLDNLRKKELLMDAPVRVLLGLGCKVSVKREESKVFITGAKGKKEIIGEQLDLLADMYPSTTLHVRRAGWSCALIALVENYQRRQQEHKQEEEKEASGLGEDVDFRWCAKNRKFVVFGCVEGVATVVSKLQDCMAQLMAEEKKQKQEEQKLARELELEQQKFEKKMRSSELPEDMETHCNDEHNGSDDQDSPAGSAFTATQNSADGSSEWKPFYNSQHARARAKPNGVRRPMPVPLRHVGTRKEHGQNNLRTNTHYSAALSSDTPTRGYKRVDSNAGVESAEGCHPSVNARAADAPTATPVRYARKHGSNMNGSVAAATVTVSVKNKNTVQSAVGAQNALKKTKRPRPAKLERVRNWQLRQAALAAANTAPRESPLNYTDEKGDCGENFNYEDPFADPSGMCMMYPFLELQHGSYAMVLRGLRAHTPGSECCTTPDSPCDKQLSVCAASLQVLLAITPLMTMLLRMPVQCPKLRPHLRGLAHAADYFFQRYSDQYPLDAGQIFGHAVQSYQLESRGQEPSVANFMAWYLTNLDQELHWEDNVWPDRINSPIRQIFCGMLENDVFFVLNFFTQESENQNFDEALHKYLPPLDCAPSFLMLSVSRHKPDARLAFGNHLDVPLCGGGTSPYELLAVVDSKHVSYVKHWNEWFELTNKVTRVTEGSVLRLRAEATFLLYLDATRKAIHTRTDPQYWCAVGE